MPSVIQGLNFHCDFDLNLVFGKHSLCKGKNPVKLLYVSFSFCKV